MARDFNGTSQYLEAVTWRALPVAYPLTIGAIVKLPSHSDYRCVLAISRDGIGTPGGLEFGLTNVGRVFAYNHGGGSLASSTTATPTGAWMFIGWSATSATGHRFYCRNLETGLLVLDETAATSIALTTPSVERLRIAADSGVASTFDYWPGQIQQVGFWDTAFDSNDFANVSRRVPLNQVHLAALKGYWFLTGIENPERDYGPYGLHVSAVNNPGRADDWQLTVPPAIDDILRFATVLTIAGGGGNTYDQTVALAVAGAVVGGTVLSASAATSLGLAAAAGPSRSVDMSPPAIALAQSANVSTLNAADLQALLSLSGTVALSPSSQLLTALAVAFGASPGFATVGGNEFVNSVSVAARSAVSAAYAHVIERTLGLTVGANLTPGAVATLANAIAMSIAADIQRTATAILQGAIAAGVSAAGAQSAALSVQNALVMTAVSVLTSAGTVPTAGLFPGKVLALAASLLQTIDIAGSIKATQDLSGEI